MVLSCEKVFDVPQQSAHVLRGEVILAHVTAHIGHRRQEQQSTSETDRARRASLCVRGQGHTVTNTYQRAAEPSHHMPWSGRAMTHCGSASRIAFGTETLTAFAWKRPEKSET